jgi:hypothetical protein
VVETNVYDDDGNQKNGAPFSKVTFEYDLWGEYLVHQGPPVSHDRAKYGPSFVQGRDNLNRVRRSDVTDLDNINKSVASTFLRDAVQV